MWIPMLCWHSSINNVPGAEWSNSYELWVEMNQLSNGFSLLKLDAEDANEQAASIRLLMIRVKVPMEEVKWTAVVIYRSN